MPRDPSSDRERVNRYSGHDRDRSRPPRANKNRSRHRSTGQDHDRNAADTTDAEQEERERRRARRRSRADSSSAPSSSNNNPLSAAALAQLNKANLKAGVKQGPVREGERTPRDRTRERTRERGAGEMERTRERERAARDSDREREREHRRRERTRERERERTRERSRTAAGVAVGAGLAAAAAAAYENDRRRPPRERTRERSSHHHAGRGAYEVIDVEPEESMLDSPPIRQKTRGREEQKQRERDKDRGRVVSGAMMEEGRVKNRGGWKLRGGFAGFGGQATTESEQSSMLGGGWGGGGGRGGGKAVKEVEMWNGKPAPWYKKRRNLCILIWVSVVVLLIIIIVAAVVVPNAGKDDNGGKQGSSPGGSGGGKGLDGISPDSIPKGAPSWLNPFVWASTDDFNLTYTDETVGDLPVMGLYTDWDDSARANGRVPALKDPWGDYSKLPARGVNVGGWLSLEPFITPSLFNYASVLGIVDEYTLCRYLAARCEQVLENHYATFVTENTFKEIAEAGLDHVRIPFSYWAVQTYDGDPYLFRTSWRYLLRAIEWCRKYGLRVNLDPHGLPGSQNGWNHSGRLGAIGWLNGTDGNTNAQRALDMHDRLSKFFAQPRYKNIISHYGLANEPKMTVLSVPGVLKWTTDAYNIIRKNGVTDAIIVFGDGFRGLENWQGELQDLSNAALDVHQYVIFNENLIVYNHSQKVKFACEGWTQQTLQSMDRSTGYGPTIMAEWSQADTDCAKHLTNVGWGNRWTGTYVTGNPAGIGDFTEPLCPTQDRRCSCTEANADPSKWSSAYKKFLRMFAEAQMTSFEKGWGWFYWVWDTESAAQWSYKKGMAAGVLPAKAWEREFNCKISDIPSFSDLPEYY